MDDTYKYCTDTVLAVNKVYSDMQEKIAHEPKNEKELMALKDFIAATPAKMEELTATLKEVFEHYKMLDRFSY
jgi:hypothetical protein